LDSPRQISRQMQKPLSNDDQWYVLKNDQKYGPVQFSDLTRFAQEGLLLEGDWVWRHGLEQWIVARDVAGLFSVHAQLRDKPDQLDRTVREQDDEGEYRRTLKERIVDSIKTFFQMFIYLWLVFGLLAIHESIILTEYQIDYQSHGLAAVKALVFAKVMLVAKDLRLGNRLNKKSLIYPILFKSFLFATALMCFHVAEHVLIGMWHGHTVTESISEIGANKLRGMVSISVIATVALIPFFILKEISRVIGEDKFWSLFFHRRDL